MTVENAISKLKVMLGAATEEVVVVENKFAEAQLVDGSEVYVEGEIQPGAILFVRSGDGASEDAFAPAGKHETTNGMIITVGESGEITNVEEKGSEETVEEAEETFEEEEVIVEEKKEFDAEGMLAGIADMLLPYTDELTKIKEELSTLKERFNTVADEPAAKPVRNTFSENKAIADQKLADRMDALRSIRKS